MLIADVDKQPAEKKRYVIDYSSWLGVGETIGSYELVDLDDELELDEDLSEIVTGGLAVAIYLGAGVDGNDYVVTIRVTTSINGAPAQIKEDEIILRVVELAGV